MIIYIYIGGFIVDNGFEDLVDSFSLAISMWVIDRGKLVLKLKKILEFFPHNLLVEAQFLMRVKVKSHHVRS